MNLINFSWTKIPLVWAAGAETPLVSANPVSGFGELLATASPMLATQTAPVPPNAGDVFVINIATPSMVIKNLGDLVSAGINAIIVIAGLLTFLYLVWGGIQWLTSGGDKEKYEAARNRITAALIGLAIISASWAAMQLVSHFFGISITTLNIPSAVKP